MTVTSSRIPIAFALAALLCSCSQRHLVQQAMNKTKVPLGYLSDTRTSRCEGEPNVVAVSVLNNPLDSLTRVSRVSGFFLPLIVYYYHEVSLFIELGQKSLEQPYDQFFAEKLADESKRSGCYTVGTTGTPYTLDITFERSHTTSGYSREDHHIYMVIVFLHRYIRKGQPSKTLMKVSAVLKKDGSTVFEKKYEMSESQAFLNAPGQGRGLVTKIESNMAENLSQTTKLCIQNIVQDLNSFFRSNP